jgi:low affinity Fe/Cu permease
MERFLRPMALRLRPSIVVAVFVVLFAVIANLAWVTAVTTRGPWFSATVSLQMYSLVILVASFLAVVLVLVASTHVTAIDATLSRLDRRIAQVRSTPAVVHGPVRSDSVPAVRDAPADSDPDFDIYANGGTRVVMAAEKDGHDALVDLPEVVRSVAPSTRTDALRVLVRERIAQREARSRVRWIAFGPTFGSVVFLAIAAMMLPGSEGFAAVHYQLNTTLLLFLAYGLAPLVAWSVLTLGMLGAALHVEAA